MSERERMRRFAELSFEISCLMTDPKDAAAARRTGIQYLEDADAADEQQKNPSRKTWGEYVRWAAADQTSSCLHRVRPIHVQAVRAP